MTKKTYHICRNGIDIPCEEFHSDMDYRIISGDEKPVKSKLNRWQAVSLSEKNLSLSHCLARNILGRELTSQDEPVKIVVEVLTGKKKRK